MRLVAKRLHPPPSDIAQISENEHIKSFFADLSKNLEAGLNCTHYHEIKRHELFILLRAYYEKEELYSLFLPLMSCNSDFRNFVFQYHKEISDVSEFASLANMTVRSFQRRFKSEFSCSAQEWLSARRAENILRELRTTTKDLSTIAREYGFSAMSYFTTFCKQHLGMTPSALRGLNNTRVTTDSQLNSTPPPHFDFGRNIRNRTNHLPTEEFGRKRANRKIK